MNKGKELAVNQSCKENNVFNESSTNSEVISAAGNIIKLRKESHMTTEKFWAIIHSTIYAQDQKEQMELIREELSKLENLQIVLFNKILKRLKDKATCWEIFGAGHVIKGAGICECFESFLLWIISKGKSVYENALKNPDSLSDVITQRDIDEGVSFERLSYIVWDVYKEKTGKKMLDDGRSDSELGKDRDIDDAEEMLDEPDIDEQLHQKLGKPKYYNYYEMIDHCPNLLQGFSDCFLSRRKNPLKGKKLGWLSLGGDLVKCEDIKISRLC